MLRTHTHPTYPPNISLEHLKNGCKITLIRLSYLLNFRDTVLAGIWVMELNRYSESDKNEIEDRYVERSVAR